MLAGEMVATRWQDGSDRGDGRQRLARCDRDGGATPLLDGNDLELSAFFFLGRENGTMEERIKGQDCLYSQSAYVTRLTG